MPPLAGSAGPSPMRSINPWQPSRPSGDACLRWLNRDQPDLAAARDAVSRVVLALTRGELQQHGVVLHTDLATGDRQVLGDRVQLQLVLLNLIMNGIQSMGAVTDHRGS
jgi:C4-dicarboxylate-specific signal transduction histidine kinase